MVSLVSIHWSAGPKKINMETVVIINDRRKACTTTIYNLFPWLGDNTPFPRLTNLPIRERGRLIELSAVSPRFLLQYVIIFLQYNTPSSHFFSLANCFARSVINSDIYKNAKMTLFYPLAKFNFKNLYILLVFQK